MRDFAYVVLVLSFYTLPLAAIAYMACAWIRAATPGRTAVRYRRRSVVFHGVSGLVLSVPGIAMAILGGLGDSWKWIAWLLGVALLGCWALAFAALARRRIPSTIAWWPLAVVIVSFSFYAMQTMEPGAAIYLSGFGLGLVAWLLVAANFWSAVVGFDETQARTRAFARYPRKATWSWPPSELAPGFVWPH